MQKFYNIAIILFVLFILLPGNKSFAQQINILVPTTDVMPQGRVNLKNIIRFRPFSPTFVNDYPAATYGIGHDTEVYAGVPFGNERDTQFVLHSSVNLNTGIKKGFNLSPTTRLALGAQITPSLSNTNTPGNLNYFIFSQKIPVLNSIIGSGMYMRNTQDFLSYKQGVLLSLQQPIIDDKLILAVDWTSRNEPYGLLAPGLIYKPNARNTFKAGVMIPNGNRALLGFIVTASRTF